MFLFLARIAIQLIKGYIKPVPLVKGKDGLLSYNIPFRCWPVDMDAFLHMNNAMYVRVAEIARWAIFQQSSTVRLTFGSGVLFLAVDQQITYLKPIGPFARYYVNVSISSTDNKWIHYKHTFQSQPSDSGQEPVVYAVVDCRAVLKEKSGKTIKLDYFTQNSEFYRRMFANNDKVSAAAEETDAVQ